MGLKVDILHEMFMDKQNPNFGQHAPDFARTYDLLNRGQPRSSVGSDCFWGHKADVLQENS